MVRTICFDPEFIHSNLGFSGKTYGTKRFFEHRTQVTRSFLFALGAYKSAFCASPDVLPLWYPLLWEEHQCHVVGDCGEFRGSAGCTHSLLSLRSEYWPHKAKNFQSKLNDNLKDMPFSFLEPAPSVTPLEDCSCFLLFITWSR
jgi:hypothetical protein